MFFLGSSSKGLCRAALPSGEPAWGKPNEKARKQRGGEKEAIEAWDSIAWNRNHPLVFPGSRSLCLLFYLKWAFCHLQQVTCTDNGSTHLPEVDVQSITDSVAKVLGPFKAPFPDTMRAIHQKQYVHCSPSTTHRRVEQHE